MENTIFPESEESLKRIGVLCAILIILLPFMVFWNVTTGRSIWAVGDFASYQVPMFAVNSQQWRHGVLPLWNPYMDGGMPLAAAQNSGSFYPLNIPLWLLLPPWTAMGYSVLLHLSLMGLGTYLFLRSLRLHPLPALFGGVAFQFSGYAMSHLGHINLLRALPWIGFALWAFNAWIATKKARYLVIISFSVMCLFLSGYPQVIVYSTLLVGSYFLFVHQGPFRPLALAITAGAIGFGLSAIQVLPGLALWGSKEFHRPGEGFYSSFTSFSFPPEYLLTLLFPRTQAINYAELVGYVGVIPLLLALIAIVSESEDSKRIRNFFTGWAIISLALSLGHFNEPLTQLTFHLPLYGKFTVISRHLLEFTFSMVTLAALGLESLMQRRWYREIKSSRVSLLGMFLIIFGLAAFLNSIAGENPPVNWDPAFRVVTLPLLYLLAGAVLIAAATFLSRKIAYLSVCCLLLIMAIDLTEFGIPIYSAGLASPEFYAAPPKTASIILQNSSESNPVRVISFEGMGAEMDRNIAKELLAANYQVTYGVESMIGHEGLQLAHFDHLFNGRIPPWGLVEVKSVEDPKFRRLLDLYGVRYLLVKRESAAPLAQLYKSFAATEHITLFESPTAKPRFFAAFLADNNTDRGELVDDSGRKWAVFEGPLPAPSIHMSHWAADRVRATVEYAQDGLLVHSTSFDQGWKAFVDGKKVYVMRVGGSLQGIVIPKGKHDVDFRYRPDSVIYGTAGSIISLGLLGVLCWQARKQKL
jgi:hypothetical protein